MNFFIVMGFKVIMISCHFIFHFNRNMLLSLSRSSFYHFLVSTCIDKREDESSFWDGGWLFYHLYSPQLHLQHSSHVGFVIFPDGICVCNASCLLHDQGSCHISDLPPSYLTQRTPISPTTSNHHLKPTRHEVMLLLPQKQRSSLNPLLYL